MNCKKCGFPLTGDDQFCKNCGAAVSAQNEQNNMQQPINNQMNQQQYQAPQQNYNQSSFANGYNQNQQQKPNGSFKYVIIGVIMLVAIVASVMITNMINNKNNNKYGDGSTDNSGLTKTSSSKSYKVNFEGFTFTIPDNLVYSEQNGVLLIGNEEGTWVTQLEIAQGSFTQLKNNKSQLSVIMQQNGYTCSAAEEKTIGGVEFITMELTYGGQKAIEALARANSMYFIGVTAYNQDNDIDYKLLETVAPIINSAEQISASNSIAPETSFDVSKFSELAK